MDEIEKAIQLCTKCGEFPKPKVNSFVKGKTNILIIGESPAKNGWLVSGMAFYDTNGNMQATGKVLDKLLRLCGLTLEDISFTECCKCLIEDRKALLNCATNCNEFLLKQISSSQCSIILPMGKVASRMILNENVDKYNAIVGKKIYKEIGGKVRCIIPIYHPSPVNPLGYKGNEKIFKELENEYERY